MKKILLLAVFATLFACAAEVKAQTPVVFAKGTSSKTITVTLPAGASKKFSVAVAKDQVINVTVSGDIQVSKTNEFPVIGLGLDNGKDGVDNWQDGEAYLSVLAGRKTTYVFTVSNGSKRARTFKMEVAVTNDPNDYQGGTE